MTVELVLFIILGAVAIASAIGMLVSQNTVYSALFLIMNFSTVAIFYLLLNAPFIALAQISVYAGAIMVLFLFVIMLLGAERLPGGPALRWQQSLAIGLAVILVAEAAYILLSRSSFPTPYAVSNPAFGSPVAVGETLFNEYLLPFEIVSILLLVGIIGAVVLTKKTR